MEFPGQSRPAGIFQTSHYELKDSGGYDAQYYAQIAMQPRLTDPALQGALDSVPYRARRILLAWTAYD